MSSRGTLKLVNAIHHRFSDNEEESKPFRGRQIILVGQFLQRAQYQTFRCRYVHVLLAAV